MKKLIEGIIEFREQRLPELEQRFQELARGQNPDTLFISCSDSRVVPSLLMSSDPGELFVMRNVGNLMPPGTRDGDSTGDLSEASALEYAVLVLMVRNIIICGHSGCGAMKAVLSGSALTDTPNLAQWLGHASCALQRLRVEGPLDASFPPDDQLSQLNVLVQIEHLLTYPIVQQKVEAGELQLSGWWFDIGKGEMSAFDPEKLRFERIDRSGVERLIDPSHRAEGGYCCGEMPPPT
jgi:carbonic anhydrase